MKKLVNDKVFKVFTITAMCLGMPLVVATGLMLAWKIHCRLTPFDTFF